MKRGFYSEKMAHLAGSAIYEGEDGQEVECTIVTSGPNHGSQWDDMQDRGPVGEYIREGKQRETPRDYGMVEWTVPWRPIAND